MGYSQLTGHLNKLLFKTKPASAFRFLGKVRLLPRLDDCPILAVDNDVDILQQCFPAATTFFHLPIRGEVIYMRPKVALWLLRVLLTRRHHQMGLRGCYVAAICKVVNPRVLVTLIDNNNWDSHLSRYLGIPIVCIANGLRHPDALCKKHFNCYFALSRAILDSKLQFDFTYEEFHAPGHIKMGLYFAEHGCTKPVASGTPPSLLWVSQYREAIYTSSQQHNIEHRETEQMGIRLMSRFAAENNYGARVAIASARKGQDRKTETDLFTAVTSGNLEYPDNVSDPWASYHEVKNADLIFGIHSTLLFESLSVSKRVVFIYPDRCNALRSHAGKGVRLDLLAPLIFSGDTYDEFSAHCNRILSMSDFEYAEMVEAIRQQMAPFDREYLPQDQIRDKISQMILD